MKLEDLTLTKVQYVVREKETGELFQNGRMFDQVGHAKLAYFQDKWLWKGRKLPSRFDNQDVFEIVEITYERKVKENTND